MLCQNCQQREATIHLYANVNGNQQEINLCQNCYQLLKQKQGNSMNSNDPFGFSSIDDLFNQLNGAQQENNLNGQPTSERPTQAGRNGGGNKRGNSILAQLEST